MSERKEYRKPEEIEDDIHQTRERLDHTLHELEERFSPQQLMNATYRYLRHGGANEFMSNLSDTVKQNPVPFLLTGAGLGWLMLAQRKTAHGGRAPSHHHGDYGNRAHDHAGTHVSPADPLLNPGSGVGETIPPTPDTHAPVGGVTGAGTTTYGSDPATAGASAMPSRATSAAGSGGAGPDGGKGRVEAVKERTNQLSGQMTDHARQLSSQVSHKAHRLTDRVKEGVHQMGHSMRDRASHTGGEHHLPSMHDMSHRARNVGSQASGFIQEHPLVAGALAFAIGAALGGMFRSTRFEDEHLGDMRDRALHKASEVGHEQAERVEATAREQVDKAREKIHEKAEQAKSDGRHDDEHPSNEAQYAKAGGSATIGGKPGVTKEETTPGGASQAESMTAPSTATSKPLYGDDAAKKGGSASGSKADDAIKSGSRSTRPDSDGHSP